MFRKFDEGEGEMLNDDGEIVVMEEVVVEIEEEEEVECKCMGFLGRMSDYRTMKIEGSIGNVDLLVLIDSGAAHNFISPKVVYALGLTITPIAAKSIKLEDGHRVKADGICLGVKMKLGLIEVVVDALVLELGWLDMVLGIAWLSTLGEVIMDWKLLTMQFVHENQLVKLQGIGSKGGNKCDLHSFLKDTHSRTGIEWWWSQFQSIKAEKGLKSQDLYEVLNEFQEVLKIKFNSLLNEL